MIEDYPDKCRLFTSFLLTYFLFALVGKWQFVAECTQTHGTLLNMYIHVIELTTTTQMHTRHAQKI